MNNLDTHVGYQVFGKVWDETEETNGAALHRCTTGSATFVRLINGAS